MTFTVTHVAKHLKQGKLAIIPTETVYALVGIPETATINAIYELKKRDYNKKLPLFVRNLAQLNKICKLTAKQIRFVNHFAPGPITFILTLKPNTLFQEYFGNKIAIRIPNSPICTEILSAVKSPLVATSVNLSGDPPLTVIDQLSEEFKSKIECAIPGDNLISGTSSTVVDLTNYRPIILRSGNIVQELIHEIWDGGIKV